MSTVRQLIEGSLKLLGVLAQGENVSGEEAVDALSRLNELVDSWSADGLMIYDVKRESFSLTSGQSSRTIGTSGDFVTSRPTVIQGASVLQNGIETPIRIYNQQEWQSVSMKASQSSLPQGIYVEDTYPNKTLNFYPVPSSTSSVVLYSLKPLTAFTSLNETIALPPGYPKALRYNLALEMAPEYGKQVDAVIAKIAEESKSTIKRLNTRPIYMRSDAQGLSSRTRFNFTRGDYE